MITINGYGKTANAGETFGAELLANRLYEGWQYNPKVDKTQKEKTNLLARCFHLLKIQLKDWQILVQWVFKEEKKSIRRFTGREQRIQSQH